MEGCGESFPIWCAKASAAWSGLSASGVLCFSSVQIASRCHTEGLLMGVCRKRERKEELRDFESLEDETGLSPGLNDSAASAHSSCT